jgi:hypothetical protein
VWPNISHKKWIEEIRNKEKMKFLPKFNDNMLVGNKF